jgi:hypothetical protein
MRASSDGRFGVAASIWFHLKTEADTASETLFPFRINQSPYTVNSFSDFCKLKSVFEVDIFFDMCINFKG